MRNRKKECESRQTARRSKGGLVLDGVEASGNDDRLWCAKTVVLNADEVQRRCDYFVAAARDCCCHWWISSSAPAGLPSQHELPIEILAPQDDTISRSIHGNARSLPSHRSVSASSSSEPEHLGTATDDAPADKCKQPQLGQGIVPLEYEHKFSHADGEGLVCSLPRSSFQGSTIVEPVRTLKRSLNTEQCCRQPWGRRSLGKSLKCSVSWGQSAWILVAVLQFALWQPTGSWIALSKDGYTIKHNLIAEAGVSVAGDLRVNGVLMSKPVSNIACTPERAGSIRWNDKYFESCDGVNDWQPMQFCDRSCAVNAHAVPCGLPVYNKCGQDCKQTGTGLNMRQCLLKTASTKCDVEVVDNCGNLCGIAGQFDCDSQQMTYGSVIIKSLDSAPSTAGYEFTVNADGTEQNKDSLFLTYKNMGGISQALTMIRRLNDHATGMEFAKPPGQSEATLRVSMLTELTGELIQLGKSTQSSQLFVDGVLDKECPLVFNGGVHDGNVTKLCLETPTQQRTLTLPDASGTVITSGNREDITNLPGLSGDNTLVYTGSYRDLGDIVVPRKARVSCDGFTCFDFNFSKPDGTPAANCMELNYADNMFDVFRIYYMLDEGSDITWPEPLRERLSFASPNIRASAQVRHALREFWKAYENHTAFERPRLELVLRFLRLSAEEAGIDVSGAFHADFDALLAVNNFGKVSGIETCFVCCGHLTPPVYKGLDKDGVEKYENATELGLVPSPRTFPKFCVGGDKDGFICEPGCPAGDGCDCPGGGACVDDPAMSCYEHDFGVKCYDLTRRPNFTSTVNFTEPTAQRHLLIPDASGTFITTGNLEDVTSMGVLTSSIVSQSSNTTTTTLQFERCRRAEGQENCGMEQVSSVLKNNTLLVPSAADGILLTTGNLEDVTLDSSSMSGLSVATDLHINGLLKFGDAATSGIRLPPRVGSKHYTNPHGNQHPGNVNLQGQGDGHVRGPGQLSFLLDNGAGGTTRVFEFEPRDAGDPKKTSYVTIPARNGTAISTGNLESITKDAGTITSLSVSGSSYLEGGLTVGNTTAYGEPTLTLQGSIEETIVHRYPIDINETHARLFGVGHPDDKWSTTKVGFQMQPQSKSDLQFPATSGTIITTGNLHDISRFEGQLLNVSGTSHMRGPVRLGSNRSTPISFSGFLEGDIVSRTAARFRDRGTAVEQVPVPFSWGHREFTFCENGYPDFANADTQSGIAADAPGRGVPWERYAGTWQAGHSQLLGNMSREYSAKHGLMMFGTAAECRERCRATPNNGCGVVVRSRYMRGSIRLAEGPVGGRTSHFVTVTPLNDTSCNPVSPTGVLTGAPWLKQLPCQRAALLDATSEDLRAWGPEHMALADIDVVIARCKNPEGYDWMPCWDMELCGMYGNKEWHQKTCEVSLRQHATGAYLGTQPGTRCYSHGKGANPQRYKPNGMDDASVCLSWRADVSLWRLEPGPVLGQQYLARVGTCVDVGPAPLPTAENADPTVSAELLCDSFDGSADVHSSSYLDSLEVIEWGMGIGGVCGAYNKSVTSCVRDVDKTRWDAAVRAKCLGSQNQDGVTITKVTGCIIRMNHTGEIDIFRANSKGKLDVSDTPANFRPKTECNIAKTRLVVQARCTKEQYMTAVNVKGDAVDDDPKNFIVASVGNEKGKFHLSTLQTMNGVPLATSVLPLKHECWLAYTRGSNCYLERHYSWDVDFYMRDEATRLTFAAPSDSQTQWFPDADGTIITSGNVEQISHLRGLEGDNTFIYSSGPLPGDPTTILDFAAMGTAPANRRKGLLPLYTNPDGKMAHPEPDRGGVRIVFPDATGTVITTGNTDDLVFKSINLEGLEVQLEANFGEPGSPEPTILNFGASSRVSGCFNFVKTEGDTPYTQLCAIPATKANRIELPDVSGTVLTTGNLLGLPSISIPNEHFFVGGDVSLEGAITLGNPDNKTTIEMFSWIDGDVGLTFQSAGGMLDAAGERKISGNTLRLSVPHMSGLDRAMRHYLVHAAKDLPVDVQDQTAYRSPVPGTSRVNQSSCLALLSSVDVGDFHALGYYLTGHHVLVPTLLRGRPYAAILDVNATEHVLPRNMNASANMFVCSGPDGVSDCSTVQFSCAGMSPPLWDGEGGTAEHGQRNRANATQQRSSSGIDSGAEDSRCAFDGDITTNYVSSHVSSVAEHFLLPVPPNTSGTGLTGRCVVGMTFSRPRRVTRFRIYVRKGYGANVVGARLEGWRESQSSGSAEPGAGTWEPLFPFERPLREEEWNDVDLSSATGPDADAYTRAATSAAVSKGNAAPAGQHTAVWSAFFKTYIKVRFVGAACGRSGLRDGVPCRCDIAEMEWHHGVISQALTPLETGVRSYFVDDAVVVGKPEVAQVLKCAEQRWYPKYLTPEEQELALPETSGYLLTTGNLRDITIEAGALSSLGVKGNMHVAGNSVFGQEGTESFLEIHSLIEGRFPLSFAEASNPESLVTLSIPDPTGDSYLHLPDASGTVVTTGSLPSVIDSMVVVGGARLEGKVRMHGDVTIGNKLEPSILEVHSPLASAFPLTFGGASPTDHVLALSVEKPTSERLLVLPDCSGTVLTTGNMPNVLESTSFTGESVFHGGVSFLEQDVVLGTRDAAAGGRGAATLELNAVLQGATPLQFEGVSADKRTLSLSVEEPSGRNTIILPDVTGTIITTGNFPDVVERLRILGDATFEGDSTLTGQHVRFGRQDRPGKLELNARITGRFPISFSDADEQGRGGSTTIEVTPPTGNNIITFPDTTGTVITTGNLPSSVILPEDDYTIQCDAFVGAASSVAMGVSATPPKHKGSFVFTDGYVPPAGAGAGGEGNSSVPPFTSRAENSFNVRATGGVKFVTGYTPSGRELGVVLKPGSSAWSVLSDRDTKENIVPVDTRHVLETLMQKVPISTWSYEGDTVRHMGPMAQDFFDAFKLGGSRRHISSIDADGVALAALQGLYSMHQEVQAEVVSLEEEARRGAEEIERNERALAEQGKQIAEAESALKMMMNMLAGLGNKQGSKDHKVTSGIHQAKRRSDVRDSSRGRKIGAGKVVA